MGQEGATTVRAVRDRELGSLHIKPSRNVVGLGDGTEVPIGQKGIELLCHLAEVYPGAVDGRQLAEVVWPDETLPQTRARNVRAHVCMVNKRLGHRLIMSSYWTARVRHPTYWLALSDGEDVEPVHRQKAAA